MTSTIKPNRKNHVSINNSRKTVNQRQSTTIKPTENNYHNSPNASQNAKTNKQLNPENKHKQQKSINTRNATKHK